MSPRLAFAIAAADKAARSTLALFQAEPALELKADATPVTEADKRAEAILRAEIEKHFPGEAILGEEQGLTGAGDDRWIIDPIDGTKSFITGVPLYATLLSYERAGEPVLGVIVFPALNELIYAETGLGAFWNGRPCRVKPAYDPAMALICAGSHKGLMNAGRLDGVLALAQRTMATRSWCDAYGHMLVATGRVDAMVDPVVSHWDISAPAIIVREAGGVFSDFRGASDLRNEGISASAAAHPIVLEAFR